MTRAIQQQINVKQLLKNQAKIVHHILAKRLIRRQRSTTRIEIALEESRYSVDPFKKLETQIQEAIEKLRPILPLSFETVNFIQDSRLGYGGPKDYSETIMSKMVG